LDYKSATPDCKGESRPGVGRRTASGGYELTPETTGEWMNDLRATDVAADALHAPGKISSWTR